MSRFDADDRFFRRVAAAERGRVAGVTESRYGLGEYLEKVSSYGFGGKSYTLPVNTTYGVKNQESIGNDFTSYVSLAYKCNGIVFAAILARSLLFSEARFCFRSKQGSNKGQTFTTDALAPLEVPGLNQTTGELLSRMEQDTSLAGNFFATTRYGGIRRMRPDLVDMVISADGNEWAYDLAAEVRGYLYWPNGRSGGARPQLFNPEEIVHWSPIPDPEMRFRGMSWLQPIAAEIQSDQAATAHKQMFFENGATVNLAIMAPDFIKTLAQLTEFKDMMDDGHKGTANAYKTLFLAAGADVKTVGADLKQMDFKATQGAGETRIALASRVPPPILFISEGMAGSSLNAGNLGVARRVWADGWARPTWRSACAALAPVIAVPSDAELWFETEHIAFLREDETDAAEITNKKAAAIRQLTDAGYEPGSVVTAVNAGNLSLLVHSGLVSVQLLPPGQQPSPI